MTTQRQQPDPAPPPLPVGFRLAGVHCGIKRDPDKEDLVLFVPDSPAVAAGLYTQNRIVAAPVTLDRQRTPTDACGAVVVNSGNANACTGEQGIRDAAAMAGITAKAVGVDASSVLVMSTGIIGKPLPMSEIESGIQEAAARLGDDGQAATAAARGLLTTDLVTKTATRTVALEDRQPTITGFAKGSGMIGPNMATLLAVILTDAPLRSSTAQSLLAAACDLTFNCVTVDGHTSTNDTILLLASGAAGGAPLAGGELVVFGAELLAVCGELARAVAADGEGATHLITVEVSGCASAAEARTIAAAVGNSPLVKTAVAGADPNWGRIVSAAGYAGIEFNPTDFKLRLNGVVLYEQGTPVPFDTAEVSESIRSHHETRIELEFSTGQGKAELWTCDLTAEYVHINADYHT